MCGIPNDIRIFGKPTMWKVEFDGSGRLWTKRFALAINCWFWMSIYFEILVFYISKLSYLLWGMYGHNVVWGLKAEDCSISKLKMTRGYWWVLCINCHLYHITTWIWPPLFIEIHIIWNTLYASCFWSFRFSWKIFLSKKKLFL